MRRRFLDTGRDTCFFLAFDLLLAGGSVGTEAGWRGASSPCSGDGMASTETGTSTSEDTSGTSASGRGSCPGEAASTARSSVGTLETSSRKSGNAVELPEGLNCVSLAETEI